MPYRLDESLYCPKTKSFKRWIWIEKWLHADGDEAPNGFTGFTEIYTEKYTLINLVNLLKNRPDIVHPHQNSMLPLSLEKIYQLQSRDR